MAVIILTRSSQNYPSVAPMSEGGFLESQSLGFLLLYPSHHLGYPFQIFLTEENGDAYFPIYQYLFKMKKTKIKLMSGK
jgi:hypothetical protein